MTLTTHGTSQFLKERVNKTGFVCCFFFFNKKQMENDLQSPDIVLDSATAAAAGGK